MVHGKPEALTASSTALKASAKRRYPAGYSTVAADNATTRCTPCAAASTSSSAVAAPAVASPRARGLTKTASTPGSAAVSVVGWEGSPPTTSAPSGSAAVAGHRPHLLAVLEQLVHHLTSDVSGCSGNQDHDNPFSGVLLRRERSSHPATAAGTNELMRSGFGRPARALAPRSVSTRRTTTIRNLSLPVGGRDDFHHLGDPNG